MSEVDGWRNAQKQTAEMHAETLSKLLALEELIRKDHTPEESVTWDMGGGDTVHYCAGCGTDLDEQDCPYLAILDGVEDE